MNYYTEEDHKQVRNVEKRQYTVSLTKEEQRMVEDLLEMYHLKSFSNVLRASLHRMHYEMVQNPSPPLRGLLAEWLKWSDDMISNPWHYDYSEHEDLVNRTQDALHHQED